MYVIRPILLPATREVACKVIRRMNGGVSATKLYLVMNSAIAPGKLLGKA